MGMVVLDWLERLDPGTHRRIRGLRLVTAYGIAAMLGLMPQIAQHAGHNVTLSVIAGSFALWASVSENRANRWQSSRDLVLFCGSAGLGALSYVVLVRLLNVVGAAGLELPLVSGAFCVGYFKRFTPFSAGIGSQIFIGQLLAYNAGLRLDDVDVVVIATVIAMVAAVVPRLLSGPAEHPILAVTTPVSTDFDDWLPIEFIMGLQAAAAALVIVALNGEFGLEKSSWAICACTFVITNSTVTTLARIRSRILGTMVGVPLAIAFLPLAINAPLLVWAVAAIAMIIYAMAFPERYDIACGAYAFALIVTLAVSGEHSFYELAARTWETVVGGTLGMAAAVLLRPLFSRHRKSPADP
ncbi:FUSC family protein [Labrys miyagiensis]|nr:FUSC family protein [Labrys miyagiensis]